MDNRLVRWPPGRAASTREVSDFLRKLDKASLKPRNVNEYLQTLAAIFNYGCRENTYELTKNLVTGIDQRCEEPPAALNYYESPQGRSPRRRRCTPSASLDTRLLAHLQRRGSLPQAAAASRVSHAAIAVEVEVNPHFARQLANTPGALVAAMTPKTEDWNEKGVITNPAELAARLHEDRRDAETFRLLFYTGLRLGRTSPCSPGLYGP